MGVLRQGAGALPQVDPSVGFAVQSGDQVNGNKEMICIGAAHIAAGFFQGLPASTSGSRTAVTRPTAPWDEQPPGVPSCGLQCSGVVRRSF